MDKLNLMVMSEIALIDNINVKFLMNEIILNEIEYTTESVLPS